MATRIYCCLLLTKCLSLVVSVSLVQTVPPSSVVCPGHKLVFSCTAIADTDIMSWRGSSGNTYHMQRGDYPVTVDGFNVTITHVNGSLVINAINDSVPLEMNGTNIGCSDDALSYSLMTIHVADVPEAVTNIKIDPVHSNGLFINWVALGSCIHHYRVVIFGNNLTNYSHTRNTNMTITSLIIGTNYSFTIIPIDTIGREGPPSSLIQYIWNVPAQVVNISWYQISNDSITIWWNNTRVDILNVNYPPVYYIINIEGLPKVNSVENTANTNITITGLPLTINYIVSIIPVNIIGYGPSATVNVSISPVKNTLFSSTDMMLSTIESDTMMSSTVTITEHVRMCDLVSMNSALTLLSVTTVTASFTTTRDHEPCVTKASNSLSTGGETISVAIGVPIMTGLITGVITAFITSIIAYCIMKRRRIKTMPEVAQEGPIYDIPIVNTEQKPNLIGTHFNAAYGQANI